MLLGLGFRTRDGEFCRRFWCRRRSDIMTPFRSRWGVGGREGCDRGDGEIWGGDIQWTRFWGRKGVGIVSKGSRDPTDDGLPEVDTLMIHQPSIKRVLKRTRLVSILDPQPEILVLDSDRVIEPPFAPLWAAHTTCSTDEHIAWLCKCGSFHVPKSCLGFLNIKSCFNLYI